MVWGAMRGKPGGERRKRTRFKLPEWRDKTRKRVAWVVSQLAVTWAGETQVVQLGASSSLESRSNRGGLPAVLREITHFKQTECEHCLPNANEPHLISSLPVMQFKMSESPEGVEDESPRCLEVIGAFQNSSQQFFVFFLLSYMRIHQISMSQVFLEMCNANF